jgi:hypothetical protein
MISDIYPATVEEGSPVLKGLSLVDLCMRDAHLPFIYEYSPNHPGHRIRLPDCKTYVYLVDSSSKGKDVFNVLSEMQTVPSGLTLSVYYT